MSRRTLAIDTAAFAGAGGLVLAAALAASAVTGLRQDRDTYRTEAARPGPTTTRVVTEPPAASSRPPEHGQHTGQADSGSTPQQGSGYAVASAPRTSAPPRRPRPGGGAEASGPRPSTPPAALAPKPCTLGLALAALKVCADLGQ